MQINPRRTPRVILAATALTVPLATGCSSSSSGGALTAAADRSETFHNVTPKANRLIQRSLPLMRGVASNTYQNGDLVVTFRSTAVKADQTNVENQIRSAELTAEATPSASPGHKKP